jgi:hypothetical protein
MVDDGLLAIKWLCRQRLLLSKVESSIQLWLEKCMEKGKRNKRSCRREGISLVHLLLETSHILWNAGAGVSFWHARVKWGEGMLLKGGEKVSIPVFDVTRRLEWFA